MKKITRREVKIVGMVSILLIGGFFLLSYFFQNQFPPYEQNVDVEASPSVTLDKFSKDDLSVSVSTSDTVVVEENVITDMPITEETELITNKSKEENVLPVKDNSSTDPWNKEWIPLSDSECARVSSSSIFYHDKNSVLVLKEKELRANGDKKSADYLREISCYPYATWLTWSSASATKNRVEDIVTQATQQGKVPVFVTYQNPAHGKAEWYSGLEGEAYLDWNRAVADAIGNRVAWVILEADAIGFAFSYNPNDQEKRLAELSSVVDIFKTRAPNTRVYLDAGHSEWHTPDIFASLLLRAGIKKADGFATNISNYESLEKELEQNNAISQIIGDSHFLIDTSRNGIGGTFDKEWCNAPGRALGVHPTTTAGYPFVDAFLWVKVPGESDGECGGGPSAGVFWLDYALGLVTTAIENAY
ncbi:MAG: glycoside hydrolase family 6 protein [Candidatus Paceibacterota bacterium]